MDSLLAIEIRDAAGEVIDLHEMSDPREAWCREWNAAHDGHSVASPRFESDAASKV